MQELDKKVEYQFMFISPQISILNIWNAHNFNKISYNFNKV